MALRQKVYIITDIFERTDFVIQSVLYDRIHNSFFNIIVVYKAAILEIVKILWHACAMESQCY